MKVVVIGGGLAGITAAIALAKAKHEVTLLEAKPRLGGATMSFNRDGLVVDTGQHVFLRCCTAYRGLLDRLGMTAHAPLQPRFDVTVVAPGKKAVMKRRRVPAPLHMLPALLGYPFLNTPERLRLTLAALAFRRLNEADPKTDELRLGDWLEAHGQDERTRRVLWDLFSVSSLNVPGDDASLALAAVVVKTGLLGSADAADIGVPALPLGDLHGTAAARVLAKLGATVRLSTKVTTIEPKGEGEFLIRLGRAATPAAPADAPAPASTGDAPAPPSTGSNAQRAPVEAPESANEPTASEPTASVPRGSEPQGSGPKGSGPRGVDGLVAPEPLSGSFAQTAPKEALESANEPQGSAGLGADGGEVILADAVVLAVPHEQAAKLIPPGALPAETVDGWAGLGAAPIVNVHVIYDRKVMDVPFAAGVDSPVQWVFDRTRISGMHARGDKGQYLAISLSAADEYALTPVAELREKFVPALAELFPAARDATVTEFFVTREKRATFRQVPGTAKLRPKAATGLPGLVLAGSWTDTGWPDTMEGAVRSGLNAVIALFPPGGTTPRTPRRPPRAGLIAKTAIVSGPPTVDKSSGVSGLSTAGESSGASAADKGSGVSGVPAADKGSRVPGAPAVGQGSEVPGAPAAGESSGVSGRPEADAGSGVSGPPAAGQGVESGGETGRGAPGETSLPGTGARTSELARADGATVNDIDNTSRPEPALGTNTEISGFEPVREAVTEVTEVTNRVNVEPDEREVRS